MSHLVYYSIYDEYEEPDEQLSLNREELKTLYEMIQEKETKIGSSEYFLKEKLAFILSKI